MLSQAEELKPDQRTETVIPLAAGEVIDAKQMVETGRVRVARVTHEREQLINETLATETVEISRVPVGRDPQQSSGPLRNSGKRDHYGQRFYC
jgi:Domain of unknown function (DUF2382)